MARAIHPETRADLLRAKSRERSAVSLPATGWRWQYGWRIKLRDRGGVWHFRETHSRAAYEEAITIRDEEMASGDYDLCWMQQKNEP